MVPWLLLPDKQLNIINTYKAGSLIMIISSASLHTRKRVLKESSSQDFLLSVFKLWKCTEGPS